MPIRLSPVLTAFFVLLSTCSIGCPMDTDGNSNLQSGEADGGSPSTEGTDAGSQQDEHHEDADAGETPALIDGGSQHSLDSGSPLDGGSICPVDGLEMAEDWGDAGPPPCLIPNPDGEGAFKGTWEGNVMGDFEITDPFDLPANGTMEFNVICSGSKYSISGQITGLANDSFPFQGDLSGEFFPETGFVQMVLNPAVLDLGIAQGYFVASMTGQRQNNVFPDGEWCGVSTVPEGASGGGTWTAILQ